MSGTAISWLPLFVTEADAATYYGNDAWATDIQLKKIGLWLDNNTALTVTASNFIDNTDGGLYLIGPGQLHDSSVKNNANGALIWSTTFDDADLAGTTIADNTGYGLYAYQTTLDLISQTADNWQISGNGTNVMGYQSDVTLDGASITGAKNYGVYTWLGSLDIDNSTITSDLSGVYAYDATTVSTNGSRISGAGASSGWGLLNINGTLDVKNTIIADVGNGLYSSAPGKTTNVYHATIADAANNGIQIADGNANVKNSIIEGSGAGLVVGGSGPVVHSHNLIHGFAAALSNTAAHDSEVFKKPRFENPDAGDYRLGKGSPAINAGDDISLLVPIDIDGNARPLFEVHDIGAYEYTQAAGSFRVIDWQEKKDAP